MTDQQAPVAILLTKSMTTEQIADALIAKARANGEVKGPDSDEIGDLQDFFKAAYAELDAAQKAVFLTLEPVTKVIKSNDYPLIQHTNFGSADLIESVAKHPDQKGDEIHDLAVFLRSCVLLMRDTQKNTFIQNQEVQALMALVLDGPLEDFDEICPDAWLAYVRGIHADLGHKEAFQLAEQAYYEHDGKIPADA